MSAAPRGRREAGVMRDLWDHFRIWLGKIRVWPVMESHIDMDDNMYRRYILNDKRSGR